MKTLRDWIVGNQQYATLVAAVCFGICIGDIVSSPGVSGLAAFVLYPTLRMFLHYRHLKPRRFEFVLGMFTMVITCVLCGLHFVYQPQYTEEPNAIETTYILMAVLSVVSGWFFCVRGLAAEWGMEAMFMRHPDNQGPVSPGKSPPEKPDYHFRAVGGGVLELRDGPPIDPMDMQFPFTTHVP